MTDAEKFSSHPASGAPQSSLHLPAGRVFGADSGQCAKTMAPWAANPGGPALVSVRECAAFFALGKGRRSSESDEPARMRAVYASSYSAKVNDAFAGKRSALMETWR